jgi:hypothetical protein
MPQQLELAPTQRRPRALTSIFRKSTDATVGVRRPARQTDRRARFEPRHQLDRPNGW